MNAIVRIFFCLLYRDWRRDFWPARQDDLFAIEKRYQKLITAGDYPRAFVEAQRLESISKARFGTTSGWYSFALSELARAEKQLGKYAEAADHCKRVLAIYEKVFGSSHQNVATALTNPAILHEHEGKYAEAADLTRRAPRMPAPGGRMPRRGRIPLISKS